MRNAKSNNSIPQTRFRNLTWATILTASTFFTPGLAQASDVYVFGDSSADLGSQGPDRRPTNKGEMWSETLAKRIGRTSTFARSLTYDGDGNLIANVPTGGNSYAVNGSTAQRYADVFTLSDQVDFFVQDKKKFQSDDLVFVWITRNDITSAFIDGVSYDPNAYADAFIGGIDKMQRAGARNIVSYGAETKFLPNQWSLDVGFTQENLDQLEVATVASEAALWPKLAAKNVYILDLNRLTEDVRLNPAKYGFLYTTENYQGRGDTSGKASQDYDNDGNVFTNDGHYTTAMQGVVSDFALAQVRARDQYTTILVDTAYAFRSALSGVGANRTDGLTAGSQDWRVFSGGTYAGAASKRQGLTDVDLIQDGFAGYAGAELRLDAEWRIGGQLDLGLRKGTFDDNSGKADANSAQISGYVTHQFGDGWFAHATASAGGVRFVSIKRTSKLGATASAEAEGSTGARFGAAQLGVGKVTRLDDWLLTAEGQWSVERTTIKGYREKSGVLALTYGESDVASNLLSVAVRAELPAKAEQFSPYAGVRYTHDFQNKDVTVRLGPTGDTVVDYVTERAFQDQADLELGVSYLTSSGLKLKGAVRSSLHFAGEKSWADATLQIGLEAAF